MSPDTDTARKNVTVPDPVRTVRVPDEPWGALQEAVLQRRSGETAAEWRKRIKDGAAGPLRLAVEAGAVDLEAFEAACQRIIREGKK